MYLFLIKKNFFDGWDNLFFLFLINIIMILLCALFATGFYFVGQNLIFALIALFVIAIVFSVFLLAIGEIACKIAGFESAQFADFFKTIPSCVKDGIFFGIALFLVAVSFGVCVPFYFSQGTMFAFCLGVVFVWLSIFAVLSLQWFIAIRSAFHNDFLKCVKKCFIIFFDNCAFSIFIFFYNVAMLIVSIPLCFLLPSFSGIALSYANAFRLRLYKYDYLESHPELKTKKERRNIPWDELLKDDKETVGKRTLKSLIFPWKY